MQRIWCVLFLFVGVVLAAVPVRADLTADSVGLYAWIDASGNLWVVNHTTNILTEIVGLATPVKTPQVGPVQSP